MEFGTRLPVNEPPDRITQTVTMNKNNINQITISCPLVHTRNRKLLFSGFIDAIDARNYSTTPQTPHLGENCPLKNSVPVPIPVVTYSNAATEKARILIENRQKSGVYRWTNLANGKFYIGSSVNLSRRFREYYTLSYLEKYKKSSVICNAALRFVFAPRKLTK